MNSYLSKQLKDIINKDIKRNATLAKALEEDEKQYGENNQVKVKTLYEINAKLNELLKDTENQKLA